MSFFNMIGSTDKIPNKHIMVVTRGRDNLLTSLQTLVSDVIKAEDYRPFKAKVCYIHDEEVRGIAEQCTDECVMLGDEKSITEYFNQMRKFCNDRYELLKNAGCKNIREYNNAAVKSGEELPKVTWVLYRLDEILKVCTRNHDCLLALMYALKCSRTVGVNIYLLVNNYACLPEDIKNMLDIKWCIDIERDVAQAVTKDVGFGSDSVGSYSLVIYSSLHGPITIKL